MENKEPKPIPVELEDEALDTVSGGTEPSQDEGVRISMIEPNGQFMKLPLYNEYNEAEKGSN